MVQEIVAEVVEKQLQAFSGDLSKVEEHMLKQRGDWSTKIIKHVQALVPILINGQLRNFQSKELNERSLEQDLMR